MADKRLLSDSLRKYSAVDPNCRLLSLLNYPSTRIVENSFRKTTVSKTVDILDVRLKNAAYRGSVIYGGQSLLHHLQALEGEAIVCQITVTGKKGSALIVLDSQGERILGYFFLDKHESDSRTS